MRPVDGLDIVGIGPTGSLPGQRPSFRLSGRLLWPKRLETVLASVIDRRRERVERPREHLAELNRRITYTDHPIGCPFDAIEGGMIGKDDAMAEERMASLKALRGQAVAEAERTQLALNGSVDQGITPTCLRHPSASLANGYVWTIVANAAIICGPWRVEVADDEVRIM